MSLKRIAIKYFVDEAVTVDLAAIIPAFHQWIQQAKVPGLLVDVADYRHMVDGPGVMLIGDAVDYAMDMGEGRPGLLYRRKRALPGDLNACLLDAFQSVLLACRLLERDESLRLRFRTDAATLVFEDRLHAPNNASTFADIQNKVRNVLETIYKGSDIKIERYADDERRCFTLRISTSDRSDLDTLIAHLS